MNSIIEGLESLGLTIVKQTFGENGLTMTLFCRVSDEPKWLPVVKRILQGAAAANGSWGGHICKMYLMHENKLVWTWNLMLSVSQAALWPKVAELVRGEEPEERPDIVIPMAGIPRGQERGAPAPGKVAGAYRPGTFKPSVEVK